MVTRVTSESRRSSGLASQPCQHIEFQFNERHCLREREVEEREVYDPKEQHLRFASRMPCVHTHTHQTQASFSCF